MKTAKMKKAGNGFIIELRISERNEDKPIVEVYAEIDAALARIKEFLSKP